MHQQRTNVVRSDAASFFKKKRKLRTNSFERTSVVLHQLKKRFDSLLFNAHFMLKKKSLHPRVFFIFKQLPKNTLMHGRNILFYTLMYTDTIGNQYQKHVSARAAILYPFCKHVHFVTLLNNLCVVQYHADCICKQRTSSQEIYKICHRRFVCIEPMYVHRPLRLCTRAHLLNCTISLPYFRSGKKPDGHPFCPFPISVYSTPITQRAQTQAF